jgi:hypothetical protein
MLSRKVVFTVVLVLILSLAALNAFANTPMGEEAMHQIYLPFMSKVLSSGTIP